MPTPKHIYRIDSACRKYRGQIERLQLDLQRQQRESEQLRESLRLKEQESSVGQEKYSLLEKELQAEREVAQEQSLKAAREIGQWRAKVEAVTSLAKEKLRESADKGRRLLVERDTLTLDKAEQSTRIESLTTRNQELHKQHEILVREITAQRAELQRTRLHMDEVKTSLTRQEQEITEKLDSSSFYPRRRAYDTFSSTGEEDLLSTGESSSSRGRSYHDHMIEEEFDSLLLDYPSRPSTTDSILSRSGERETHTSFAFTNMHDESTPTPSSDLPRSSSSDTQRLSTSSCISSRPFTTQSFARFRRDVGTFRHFQPGSDSDASR